MCCLKSIITYFLLLVFVAAAAVVGYGVGKYYDNAQLINKMDVIESPEATVIYAANKDDNGNDIVIDRIYTEDRTNVDLEVIPDNLKNATIAVEDKRFYEHGGLDFRGMFRAMFKNFSAKSMAQGGSTITMQLARNLKLGFGSEKTLDRKVQEVLVAFQLERELSKDKILESYLNRIYYGNGAFGVQAASKTYFNKDVKDLTLSECAFLAGLPKAPSFYAKNNTQANERRNVVLKLMLDQGYITSTEYEAAVGTPMKITITKSRSKGGKYQHFVNYLIKELGEHFDEDEIYNGGLRIYSTLDTRIQDSAEKVFYSKNDPLKKRYPNIESCFISIQPGNGFIRAMIGSINRDSEFNRATQAKRQPGSVFKVVDYCCAMEKLGWGPSTRISNERFVQGKWRPKNFDGKYGGTVTMRQAVQYSINMPAIRAAERAGIENVVALAKRMGIETPIEPVLSAAIGGMGGIKPIEMLMPYTVIANNGILQKATCIDRVYDSDKKNIYIDNHTPKKAVRVIGENVNRNMDSMLRSVVTSGTGRQVSSVRDARGKTGTNGMYDVWFAGYVPGVLTAIVWLGSDDYSRLPGYFSGGGTCGPIWRDYMNSVLKYMDGYIDKEALKSIKIEDATEPGKRRVRGDERARREPKIADAPIIDDAPPAEPAESDGGGDEPAPAAPRPSESEEPSVSHDDVTAVL
ncbi:MAG: PBP1A family penicillin-binding protein [Abditibacteriota bacterium]|nr:PBP1A family penicillin-binding protein [Abditibacteriota bacterium]